MAASTSTIPQHGPPVVTFNMVDGRPMWLIMMLTGHIVVRRDVNDQSTLVIAAGQINSVQESVAEVFALLGVPMPPTSAPA